MLRVAFTCFALLTKTAAAQALVKTTLPVSGLKCNGNQTAWVLYPDDGQKYPLVSFAHGYTAQDVPEWFPYLLEGIAKRGYVVVASEAGTDYCTDQTYDQVRCLQWAQESSELSPHIDTKAGTGIVGHSMGGGSTITTASNASATSAYNIKVAVAMHPASGNPNAPKIPILYLSGTADVVVPSSGVLSQYNAAENVIKTFADVKGASHVNCCGCPQGCENICTPRGGCPNTEDAYAWYPLDCYLKGDMEACKRVNTCTVPNAVTGEELEVTECYHSPGTDFITTV